ncbi:MAG: hypothetical protein J4F48_12260 [Nitrospinae bacterium]|nr:hypothetical protein [Nitrospinota bacterium]
MDRGIWASWYDLPEDKREDYCAWLHGRHLPAMLERAGFLWAAHYEVEGEGAQMKQVKNTALTYAAPGEVPGGTVYVLLIGAASPHVFFDPALADVEKEHSDETRAMLALREGLRECIFSEEARVDGEVPASRRGPRSRWGSSSPGTRRRSTTSARGTSSIA